ncbi:maleylpyruvate isomerase N-terminal domain-containing protein [Nocardioides sp. B-3]|uniref:maleylpyruvate isomerase N-terminal domain-containing protein n=1 Tax=Nocardioides sp. B-3 TaxID=2895565 RepID=UPI00215371D5|nr:maleylpyruvate isomerase N-terminal domain-containing protein [Nocardioides sp. B-3]UUZ60440.1 maleylpyruvate isomerase N-terminal domain-containing protein [Nocardioides sp. B-3]
MDTQTVWAHIHTERRALAATLADSAPEQWLADSLCAGWTVHDVAAHVISHPADRLGPDARDGGPELRPRLQRDDLPRGQAHGCELDPRDDPRRLRHLRRLDEEGPDHDGPRTPHRRARPPPRTSSDRWA